MPGELNPQGKDKVNVKWIFTHPIKVKFCLETLETDENQCDQGRSGDDDVARDFNEMWLSLKSACLGLIEFIFNFSGKILVIKLW